MDIYYNKHYIAVDAQNRISDGWSDGPHPGRDISDAICINAQGGYQFRLFPGGNENPPLHTADSIPLYNWNGHQVQSRSEAEISADRTALPAPPPSPLEQLQAENALLKAQIAAASDRQDFLEDCIAEMATQIYGA